MFEWLIIILSRRHTLEQSFWKPSLGQIDEFRDVPACKFCFLNNLNNGLLTFKQYTIINKEKLGFILCYERSQIWC